MSALDTMTDNKVKTKDDKFQVRFKINFTNSICALALFLSIFLDRNVGIVIAGLGLIGRSVVDLAEAWRGHTEAK